MKSNLPTTRNRSSACTEQALVKVIIKLVKRGSVVLRYNAKRRKRRFQAISRYPSGIFCTSPRFPLSLCAPCTQTWNKLNYSFCYSFIFLLPLLFWEHLFVVRPCTMMKSATPVNPLKQSYPPYTSSNKSHFKYLLDPTNPVDFTQRMFLCILFLFGSIVWFFFFFFFQ